MAPLLMTITGAVGAVCRYLLSGWVQRVSRSDVPVGTLVVNLGGAFILGIAAGAGQPESLVAAGLVGFLGGFTTFSTWMVESLRLGPVSIATLLNLSLTLVAGVALAALGFTLTS